MRSREVFSVIVFGHFAISLFVVAGLCSAQVNNEEMISEIVPADLESWSIEFSEFSREQGRRRVTLDNHGKANLEILTRRIEQNHALQFRESDKQVLFDDVRKMFNHLRFESGIRQGDGGDVYFTVKIQVENGKSVHFKFFSEDLASPMVHHFVKEFQRLLRSNGVEMFAAFKRELGRTTDFHVPDSPLDRFLKKDFSWILRLSEKGPPPRAVLEIGQPEVVLWKGPTIPPRFNLTPAQIERRYVIAHKILNRYRLSEKANDEVNKENQTFEIGIQADFFVFFACDRQSLIDMDVLKDLDAWVLEINQQLEATETNERYFAPWALAK